MTPVFRDHPTPAHIQSTIFDYFEDFNAQAKANNRDPIPFSAWQMVKLGVEKAVAENNAEREMAQ